MYVKDMFLLLIFVYLGYQGDEGDISSTGQHVRRLFLSILSLFITKA